MLTNLKHLIHQRLGWGGTDSLHDRLFIRLDNDLKFDYRPRRLGSNQLVSQARLLKIALIKARNNSGQLGGE